MNISVFQQRLIAFPLKCHSLTINSYYTLIIRSNISNRIEYNAIKLLTCCLKYYTKIYLIPVYCIIHN